MASLDTRAPERHRHSVDQGATERSFRHRLAARAAREVGVRWPAPFAGRVRRPVFLIGCGRSGSSALYDTLAAHPAVAAFVSEANELWHPGMYPWRDAPAGTLPYWIDPVAYTEASLRRHERDGGAPIAGVLGAYQTLARRPVLLTKSVMLSFMVPWLVNRFPDCRLIHLIRDGRAVALSYEKRERAKIEADPTPYRAVGCELDREELLDALARHWQDHIEAIERADRELALSASGRLLTIRYEDLCADPDLWCDRICELIGIDPRRLPSEARHRLRSRNHKMGVELDAESLAQLEDAIGGRLRALRYV